LIRAPRTLSQIGLEWLWILTQQPQKLRVYTIGALQFLGKILALVRWNAA
jgi:UDP-N-acetyl-D-mannosaminuronic acid transferase (WecB/TagA/CpsF family)